MQPAAGPIGPLPRVQGELSVATPMSVGESVGAANGNGTLCLPQAGGWTNAINPSETTTSTTADPTSPRCPGRQCGPAGSYADSRRPAREDFWPPICGSCPTWTSPRTPPRYPWPIARRPGLSLELIRARARACSGLREIVAVLKPGGTVIFRCLTVPRHDDHDYWRFTAQGLAQLGSPTSTTRGPGVRRDLRGARLPR